MRVIMLTPPTAKGYFDATVLDSKGSFLDNETLTLINNIIRNVTGLVFDEPENQVSVHLSFIYMMLNMHSPTYAKASAPQSGISNEHLASLLARLHMLNSSITADDILVIDRMDILYGTTSMLYSEHSKFSVWFYEMAYEIATNTIHSDRADEVFEEAVVYIEKVISSIEKNIIFIGQDLQPDDLVVMCVYPINGYLLFILD